MHSAFNSGLTCNLRNSTDGNQAHFHQIVKVWVLLKKAAEEVFTRFQIMISFNPPTAKAVDQFLKNSTGMGAPVIEYVQCPPKPVADGASAEVTREIQQIHT
jgi:hypothetical protein